ncbi:hypothetical protein [Natronorubrum sulfidifaciens]|uniref:DUF8106 domain-containing protein n=1 Tax=Natronorubrum sulfidifaciens JCM 14089 TaxID=1230460 RepID=L9WJ28_9EURY|nr:hypothetical protein [Natronorubrum sulfidifaciens]ELY49485.1 hypothetical protein C495_00930 [Natronorubrum sulfidifaciens JCM 14089]
MTHHAVADDGHTPVPQKSTLFCWGCDHQSPLDGDWDRRTVDRHVEYVCPVCATTISKRPLPAPASKPMGSTPLMTWQRTVRTTMDIWRASIDIGLSTVSMTTHRK